MQALLFDRFGDAGVLRYATVPDPRPRQGHAIVRTAAIGLNFADIYRRNGNYHLAGEPPWVLGYEAAGTVESIDGHGFEVGSRVAFADCPHANAELASVPIDKLIALPDSITFETAAAALLQGLTAQYLTEDSHRVSSGESILVHAAAGGVGLLLVQYAKAAGAFVCGLVSSEEKRRAALDAGADRVLLYRQEWVSESRALTTGGAGFDAVFDSVGTTVAQSLDAARLRGTVVFFGMAAGDPAPVDPRRLMDESKTLTGGDLWNYLTSATERRSRAARLFASIHEGRLHPRIAASFPLAEGAAAHRFLESRRAIGKVLLVT
jgi:NADPH2:quinone reductase